jgi:hypothetical protein
VFQALPEKFPEVVPENALHTVMPRITAPAARTRATAGLSWRQTLPAKAVVPFWFLKPSTPIESLKAIGTPQR